MTELTRHIGARIHEFRRERKLTLQQLADLIHKSRATVSKYESGEITLDVDTLWELSHALGVDLCQLTDYQPPVPKTVPLPVRNTAYSPFFAAEDLYFYFYDGRYHQLKDDIIHVEKHASPSGTCPASLVIRSTTPSGRRSEVRYRGKVVYSDMLIRFSFVNEYNSLEEDLLYIFNPLELRDFTDGLLCGISSIDLMPCAFRCLVTLNPREHSDELRRHLLVTPDELRRWQRLNMLVVDNRI